MKFAWINVHGKAIAQKWPAKDFARIYENKKHEHPRLAVFDIAEEHRDKSIDELKLIYPLPEAGQANAA